jgi:hypothetical protein
MGLKKGFRELLRMEAPTAFNRRGPVANQRFDCVMCDMEQMVFRMCPARTMNRSSVLAACVEHLKMLAYLAHASNDPANAGKENLIPKSAKDRKFVCGVCPLVYALFDTAKFVTKAKDPCKMKRYKSGKKPPIDVKEQTEAYRAGHGIHCDWWTFLADSESRRCVLDCLSEDLSGAHETFEGVGILIIDDGKSSTDATVNIGEAEHKIQALCATHEGSGVIIDSSDNDLLVMWLLCARITKTKNMCLRSMVGSQRKLTFGEMKAAAIHACEGDESKAMDMLSATGITEGMKECDMPDDACTKAVSVEEYTDLNELYTCITKHGENRASSLAFIGLLCGSDLVMGSNYSNPLPNVGEAKAISYYLDNYVYIGDIVRSSSYICDQSKGSGGGVASAASAVSAAAAASEFADSGPVIQSRARMAMRHLCSLKAFWTYIRMMYWSKYRAKIGETGGVIPTYDQLVAASCTQGKACSQRSASRSLPTAKSMLVTFCNCRYAVGYYGMDDPGDPLEVDQHTGRPVHGWMKDKGEVKRVGAEANTEDGDSDEDVLLYNQEEDIVWANKHLEYSCGSCPPPMSMMKSCEKRAVERASGKVAKSKAPASAKKEKTPSKAPDEEAACDQSSTPKKQTMARAKAPPRLRHAESKKSEEVSREREFYLTLSDIEEDECAAPSTPMSAASKFIRKDSDGFPRQRAIEAMKSVLGVTKPGSQSVVHKPIGESRRDSDWDLSADFFCTPDDDRQNDHIKDSHRAAASEAIPEDEVLTDVDAEPRRVEADVPEEEILTDVDAEPKENVKIQKEVRPPVAKSRKTRDKQAPYDPAENWLFE